MNLQWTKKQEIYVVVKSYKTVNAEDIHDLDSPYFEYEDIKDKALFIGRGFKCRIKEWIHRGDYGLVEVLLDGES